MRPLSAVVVDLPFVPVTATTRPRSHRAASSISLMTGTPAARARATTGIRGETPGLSTIRSAASNVAWRWPPSSSATPRRRSAATPAPSAAAGRASLTVTRAPRRAASAAAARPLRAAPATTTCDPVTENWVI